jgi:replicative DNA helicase
MDGKALQIDVQDANSDPTQVLPHSIEAEQALLGALLINNDVFDRVDSLVKKEHFFDPVHGRIFEVIARRIQKNSLASPVTVKAFLEEDPGLTELGGPAYLVRLAGASMSVFAAKDYAQIIYDMAIRRNLISIGEEITSKANAMNVDDEPKEQIVAAEQQLYALGEQGSTDSGFQSFLKPSPMRLIWPMPPTSVMVIWLVFQQA